LRTVARNTTAFEIHGSAERQKKMQIKPNSFICADSIEVLREIQDKAFDLCLTDPPYGIGESGQRNITGDRPTSKWKNPTSDDHSYDYFALDGSCFPGIPAGRG
jgi:DNA modification methylase